MAGVVDNYLSQRSRDAFMMIFFTTKGTENFHKGHKEF